MASSEPKPATSVGARPPQPTALDRIPLLARMLIYAAVFLGVILVLLPWLASQFDALAPSWRVELGAFRWVGWAIFSVCLAIYLYSSYVLSSRGRGAYVEFDPPREFVAVGPFRWCRNPIAACVVGMLLGLGAANSSTGILLLFAISVPLAHAQVILLEEPLLRQRFGEPYLLYTRTVPRWLPRPPQRAAS